MKPILFIVFLALGPALADQISSEPPAPRVTVSSVEALPDEPVATTADGAAHRDTTAIATCDTVDHHSDILRPRREAWLCGR